MIFLSSNHLATDSTLAASFKILVSFQSGNISISPRTLPFTWIPIIGFFFIILDLSQYGQVCKCIGSWFNKESNSSEICGANKDKRITNLINAEV